MALTDEEKEEYKTKFGEVVYLAQPEGEFLFRKPARHVWARFVHAVNKEGRNVDRMVGFEQLCTDCLVHPANGNGKPDYAKLQGLFERLPALPVTIGGELSDLAGSGESVSLGKL